MELILISLLTSFLFYDYYLKNKNKNNTTRLDQLIKYLKDNKNILNEIKLNETKNELLIGDDNLYLSFNNNEDIILNINKQKISLKTNDTNKAMINLQKLINESKKIIEKNNLDLTNMYISFNKNKKILNINNKKILLKTNNEEEINKIKNDIQNIIEKEKIKLNDLNKIYDILNKFKNYYYYNKYLKYKNKYLLIKN